MFGIDPTPFDLRLVAFRIPIRVHPSFWIFGALMRWDENHLDLVFMWVMCLFVSILVHELGHALMAEAFGWGSEIVLYWCGGLAFSQRNHNRTPWREIAVALAGPFAGFGLFFLTFAALIALPFMFPGGVHRNVGVVIGDLILINLIWGMVNLLPVLPLDGGHVCQHFLTWCQLRDPVRVTMYISIPVAMLASALFFWLGLQFAGILFAVLCLQNIVALQSPHSSSW